MSLASIIGGIVNGMYTLNQVVDVAQQYLGAQAAREYQNTLSKLLSHRISQNEALNKLQPTIDELSIRLQNLTGKAKTNVKMDLERARKKQSTISTSLEKIDNAAQDAYAKYGATSIFNPETWETAIKGGK